ncbi:hypothetical protein LTS18_011517, partial [Coniosporium uncinatum]
YVASSLRFPVPSSLPSPFLHTSSLTAPSPRSCSLTCFKTHKTLHETNALASKPLPQPPPAAVPQLPPTTATTTTTTTTTAALPPTPRTPLSQDPHTAALLSHPAFTPLFTRYPNLKQQLRFIYRKTLPPDEGGMESYHMSNGRGGGRGGRGRGRGRGGGRGGAGGRGGFQGVFKQEKADERAGRRLREEMGREDGWGEGLREFGRVCLEVYGGGGRGDGKG